MADARAHSLITDFTTGELSPRWMARVDEGGGLDPLQGGGSMIHIYHSGCRELTNMIVMPQGGVTKRTGTLYGRDISADIPGVSASDIQLFKFEFPGADFLMLFAPGVVNVYNTASFGILSSLPAPVFTGSLPYAAADVRLLQVAQLQDTLVMFTPAYRPRILRLRANTWSLVDAQASGFVAPLYDFRDQLSPPSTQAEYTIDFVVTASRIGTPYVSGIQGGTNTITKNNPTATLSSLILSLTACPSINPATLEVTYTGASNTELKYNIKYSFLGSVGNGTGQLTYLEGFGWPSTDSVEIVNVAEGNSGAEPLWSGLGYIVHNAVYYKCLLPHITATTNEPGVGVAWQTYWVSLGPALPPVGDWTHVFDGASWVVDLAAGPFNRGWPSTGTAHEQRMVANGPPTARGVIAGSRTGVGKLLDFTVGPNAGDAFVFLLVVANGLSVVWLHSQKLLYVGTSIGVFVQTEVPLTPSNVNFSRQSNYSLDTFRGFDVAGEVFYVQRNGRQIRRMQYIDTLQSWQATDFTSYAEHLFTEGTRVRDQSYMNSPDGILWVLRDDGGLMSFTYERYYGVAAWAKHSTQGTVRALETFFGGAAPKDQVSMIVERPLWNGTAFVSNVYLEMLAESTHNEWRAVLDTTSADWSFQDVPARDWYSHLDAVSLIQGNGGLTLSVPRRFRNREVSVVEDGVDLGVYTVSQTDTVTLYSPSVAGSSIYVGYGFPSRVRPTRYEIAAQQTSQSRHIRWVNPRLRLFASTMPTINGAPAQERAQNDLYDTATGLFTGDVSITNLGYDGELVIEANAPLPFMMTGIFGVMTVSGD
jgi:hypothetical protein